MRSFAKETVDLLQQLRTHGPITVTEFKEAFPKVMRHSYTLHKLVVSGVLYRDHLGYYRITPKGRTALGESVVTTATAKSSPWAEGKYTGQRMTPMRAGAEGNLRLPSLISGQRVYRKEFQSCGS